MGRIYSLAFTAILGVFVWTLPVASTAVAVNYAPQNTQQQQSQEQQPQPSNTQQQPAEQQPATPQAENPDQTQDQTVMLTGTVVQQNGQFVLQDSGKTYKLNDQNKAKKFENKKVRVMGTLNGATNTVQVTEIKPAG